MDRRAFSWTGLFAALEGALPPGVKLVSVSPQTKAGRTELSLDGGGPRAARTPWPSSSRCRRTRSFEGAFLNGWTEGREGVDISCTVRYVAEGARRGGREGRP